MVTIFSGFDCYLVGCYHVAMFTFAHLMNDNVSRNDFILTFRMNKYFFIRPNSRLPPREVARSNRDTSLFATIGANSEPVYLYTHCDLGFHSLITSIKKFTRGLEDM